MFDDERINAECGKIYRKGILLAVLTTLLYVLSRTVTLLIQSEFHTFFTYTEALLVILGGGILTVGAIRFHKHGDERMLYEKHMFYLNAGKIFILAVFGAYILTIPFTTEEMLGGQTHNHLLILLEILGCLYLFYAFKTKEINFNYSFIAESGARYYGKVLMNIGGLWLALLVPFLLSASWELILNESWRGALTILLAYIISSLGLSGEYFFLSLVEKMSYDTMDGKGFALGTRIAATVCLTAEFISSLLYCVYVHFVTGNLMDIPSIEGMGSIIAIVSQQQKQMNMILIVLTGLAVSQLMAQLRKGTLLYKICSFKMLLLAISALQETLMPVWYRAASEEALRFMANYVDEWLRLLSFGISVTMWILFVHSMIKDLNAPRFLRMIPVFYIIAWASSVFFVSQSMLRMSEYLSETIHMACLILITSVIWKYDGFETEEAE